MSDIKIKNIGIAGAGGIGAYLVQFLFDYGVSREQFPWTDWTIDLYDNDTVDVGNLLHQNFKSEDLGKYKAEVVADKCFVNPIKEFMTVKDFDKYDVIFSCVDSMNFRYDLYHYGWEKNKKLVWFDGRCNSRNIGIFNSTVSRKVLEKHISKDEERRGCLREVDKINKVSHATPLIVAGLMTQSFMNFLRGDLSNEELLLML